MLKNNLDDILLNYELNIGSEGKNILKELADDERNINYKSLFFKSGNPTIDNYDFFKRFGTLYDLLINLLTKKISLKRAELEQSEMMDKIIELGKFVSLEEENTDKERSKGAIKKVKTITQRRKTISIQKSVLNNAVRLFNIRGNIINAFINKDILTGNLEEDVSQKEEPEYQESIAEKTKLRRQDQQSAKGLKILTPQQMLSRLPISLAQLKAGNNSEKLKNEIRQLIFFVQIKTTK